MVKTFAVLGQSNAGRWFAYDSVEPSTAGNRQWRNEEDGWTGVTGMGATRFANLMAEQVGEPIDLVSPVTGGLAILEKANPEKYWLGTPGPNNYFERFFAIFDDLEIDDIEGVILLAGERDASSGVVSTADFYTGLEQFSAALNTYFGRVVPMRLAELGVPPNANTNWDNVREAQRQFTNDNDFATLFPADISNDNGVHYSGAGYYQLATAAAGVTDLGSLIAGTPADEEIIGTADQDFVGAHKGADIIRGGDGNDSLHGELGDDTIYGDAGEDALYGGDDNDTLWGGVDNDRLFGGIDNDILHGDAGDDFLSGDVGQDTIYGGEGDDLLVGGLNYREGKKSIGDLDFLYGEGGNDKLKGGSAADFLDGGDGQDFLIGSVGDDTLKGGAGDDRLKGDAGDDRLEGEAGNDTLNGGNGDDTILGGLGRDRIKGENDNDTLNGGEDNDIIKGGEGDDILNGDAGDDILLGENGNDTLNGGEGNDNLNGANDDDTLSGMGGDDRLNGGAGDDSLDGGADNDFLNSGAGNDELIGGDGDDILRSGSGNDSLLGGDGADVLTAVNAITRSAGRGEIDTLNGGLGADRYILGEADGRTVFYLGQGELDYAWITQFDDADVIQLKGKRPDYTLGRVASVNNDAGIFYKSDLIAVLANTDVTEVSLGSALFEYV